MITRHNGNTELLVDVWLRASARAHNFIDPAFWQARSEAMRDVYLPSAENYVWIDSDGSLYGFISLRDNHIEALFVDPAHQGKGVGRALLDFAKDTCPQLTLAVYERNGKAVVFYHRNRFAVRERRVDALTGEYELLMEFTPM